jgi:predicted TIM-barrel fold metal-dependent hydrolase
MPGKEKKVMAVQMPVISADSHVNIPEPAYAEYMPARLKDRAPRVEHGKDRDWVVFEGERMPIQLMSAVAGQKYEDYRLNATRLGEGAVGGYDPQERLKDMDTDGVDAEVLFGTVAGPFSGGYINKAGTPELKLALRQAYNDWLADYCKAAPDRLIGLGEMPDWSLEATLAEAKRVRDKGLKGIIMPSIPLDHNYMEPYWEPLWDLLEDLDMPMHMHLGPRPLTPGLADNLFCLIILNKPMMAEPLVSAIFAGVFERHPKLRMVSVESGAGWAAFTVPWMDNAFERHRYWQNSTLKKLPSYYWKKHVKLTFIEDPVAVRERHTIGIDCLMWSSDYPHSDSTWPHSQKWIAEHFEVVPEGEKQQIIAGNAAKVYGLRLAK